MKFLTLTNKQAEYVSHITYSRNIKLSGCGAPPAQVREQHTQQNIKSGMA